MIEVKVTLISAINGKRTRLGRLLIANDGTGTNARRNYHARLYGRDGYRMGKTRLVDWPSKREHPWNLVLAILKQLREKPQ